MRMVINICDDLIEVDSESLCNMVILNESKIGDTYFIETVGGYLSCHENFWIPFKREYKINSIILSKRDP